MSSPTNKKRRFTFIKVIFIFFNVLCVIALGLSYLAPFVSPETNSLLPFFGLAYPLLALANAAFVVIWMFFNWRWALLSLLMLVLGWNHISSSIQYHSDHTFDSKETPIHVLSYNVRNFDIYNYDSQWRSSIENRDKILSFLKNTNPGIICFQEYVHDLQGNFQTTDTLVSLLQPIYVDTIYTVKSRGIIEFGLATFSKYPIVKSGSIKFENSSTNFCLYTDVLINDDTIRIYNAHFESIHLSKKDYDYASEVTALTNVDAHKKSGRRIFSLLRAAFRDRASQAEQVAAHIASSPYPVILCTDLNDTPSSYAYRCLHKKLNDAFVESGHGLGSTYAGIFPSFRIDYIMHSESLKAYNFETQNVKYSDHYPITCDIIIPASDGGTH